MLYEDRFVGVPRVGEVVVEVVCRLSVAVLDIWHRGSTKVDHCSLEMSELFAACVTVSQNNLESRENRRDFWKRSRKAQGWETVECGANLG
jgi:hypothetical protein